MRKLFLIFIITILSISTQSFAANDMEVSYQDLTMSILDWGNAELPIVIFKSYQVEKSSSGKIIITLQDVGTSLSEIPGEFTIDSANSLCQRFSLQTLSYTEKEHDLKSSIVSRLESANSVVDLNVNERKNISKVLQNVTCIKP